ncbi:EAL domain-containing protein [Myxosarcina sp. GI1]|uniref:EAL domain-containing protein n=1 Tax=Myxosarcina sp. GI1 TaxID=1541065 RepID=UPI00068B647A|nr:EAL domain-containing protein [Myxosarcina sp. GI1]
MNFSSRRIISQSQLNAFELLSKPIWIFKLEERKVWWANQAGKNFGNIFSLEQFIAREANNFEAETGLDLQNYWQQFSHKTIDKTWTFSDRDSSVSLWLTCSFVNISTDKLAILVEGNLDLETKKQIEVLNQTTSIISVYNFDGSVVMQNSAARLCYGNNRAFSEPNIDFFKGKFVNPGIAERAIAYLERGETFNTETEVYTLKNIRWHELRIEPINSFVTQKKLILVTENDITERKQSELALYAEKEFAHLTLNSISDAIVATNIKGKIKYFNSTAEKLSGLKSHEVKGKFLTEVLTFVDEETRQPIIDPVARVLREDRTIHLAPSTVFVSQGTTEYAVDSSISPIKAKNDKIMGLVLVFKDVTSTRKLNRQLSWQATHDYLTKLFNRQEFERRLQTAINTAKQEREHHVFCYMDLDQFKIVNDTCGHLAGDELLRQIATILQQRVRATDTLARLGGDEFGLLLYQCSLLQAEETANTLKQIIRNFRFIWQGKSFNIGVSIGLVIIDEYTTDLAAIFSAADAACYAAKEDGRNCVKIYRLDDNNLAKQRGERRWISRIKQAIAEDRFCLYCQKIVPVEKSSKIEYYEILLRLQDEAERLIPPMAFIPAAERYGLMITIDCWVISTFFAYYDNYCEQHLSKTKKLSQTIFTINISGVSINNPQFLNFIKDEFSRSRFSPQICFEITETSAIANLAKATQFINELKTIGCCFALDDFGRGMSSLYYLKNLPVDYLKIDGSFIKNLDRDRVNYVMIESFNRIGHAMGIKTIVEFVEDSLILTKLEAIGIDYAQGYGISRPQSIDLLML